MTHERERQWKWDNRFLQLAETVAQWSKDPSTKVGAVIVRPDLTIASLGYNGFARGCLDTEVIYDNRERKYQRVIHAEMNAVLTAREPLHGYTLYTTPPGLSPTCDRCAAHVIQSGIKRVVCRDQSHYHMAGRWADAWAEALNMYCEAGVSVVHVPVVYQP